MLILLALKMNAELGESGASMAPQKHQGLFGLFAGPAIGHVAAKWPLIHAGPIWLSEKGQKGPIRHFGSSQRAKKALGPIWPN